MKKNAAKPTLDDIAFEGRNKAYGVYMIRKTYQPRLLRSFAYSVCFSLIFLLVFEQIHRKRMNGYYYNLLQNSQVVDVNFSQNPYPAVSAEQAGGTSVSSKVVVPSIVADNEIIADQDRTEKPVTGGSDSTGTDGNGTATSGMGTSSESGNGMEGEVYGSADVNPQFPGGPKAMQAFINENLQYPEIARRLDMKGTILIYIVIASNGSLRDIKVVRGLQADLDNEAVRVIKTMPLWKPALRGGIPVNVRCVIPITVSPIK